MIKIIIVVWSIAVCALIILGTRAIKKEIGLIREDLQDIDVMIKGDSK